MKYFMGPLNLTSSDRAIKTLVRKGSATDDQLFEAQFGQWPANGLQKDTDCSDLVNFKGFWGDRKLNPLHFIFRSAYTRKEDEHDRTIYLNGLQLTPLAPVLGIAASRLAWARLHDVAGLAGIVEAPMFIAEIAAASALSSYRYAIASSLARLITPSLSDLVGEEHIHIKQFKEDNRAIAADAFQNAAYDWMNNQGLAKRYWTEAKQGVDAVLTMMPRSYFSSDHELQARLHNIVVHGYRQWGQIPQTKDELYIALKDMGIKSPSIVDRHYADSEFDDLKNIFGGHSGLGYLNPPNAEMNIGLNSFRDPEVLEMYWRDCLPILYGDLLVKYGDSKGNEKMGLSDEVDVLGLPLHAGPDDDNGLRGPDAPSPL